MRRVTTPSDRAHPGTGVRVPALTSRSGLRWLVATAVACVAVAVVVFVGQPENRVFVVTVLPGLALFFLVLAWQSTWLDPEAGVVVRVRCRWWRRSVPLGPTTSVSLAPNGGGGLLLALRPRGARRRTFVTLLALTDHVERSQAPELLRLLADTLEHHRTGGARGVVAALRTQAEHLEQGGDARTSPLAASVTYGAVNAAKAGGAAAVGSNLLD